MQQFVHEGADPRFSDCNTLFPLRDILFIHFTNLTFYKRTKRLFKEPTRWRTFSLPHSKHLKESALDRRHQEWTFWLIENILIGYKNLSSTSSPQCWWHHDVCFLFCSRRSGASQNQCCIWSHIQHNHRWKCFEATEDLCVCNFAILGRLRFQSNPCSNTSKCHKVVVNCLMGFFVMPRL